MTNLVHVLQYPLRATQMGCVYVTYLRLTNSILLPYLSYYEPFWSVSDSLPQKVDSQSTQDGNLVEVFCWEESKMATSMFDILDGFSFVWVIMEDILVYASTEKEHDERLGQVFQRCRDKNIKLNQEKCKFKAIEVKYMGHVLSSEGWKADLRNAKNKKK